LLGERIAAGFQSGDFRIKFGNLLIQRHLFEKKKMLKRAFSVAARPPATDPIWRLDFRVGRIVACQIHPQADHLFVERVVMGDATERTIVSGLARFVPLDSMQNRLVVVAANLKPSKCDFVGKFELIIMKDFVAFCRR
jgi:tRNA-binding EMAP/Myf-like protein